MHPRIQHLAAAAGPYPEPLWERETELAQIQAAIGAVGSGASRILAIEGPTGIGKTRLIVRAERAAADAGVRILSARATELERNYSFGIARQWLEPVLAAASNERREAWLEGAAALARPVLSLDPVPEPVAMEAAMHGLYWVLANLSSDAPLVLTLDDGQWADEPSLRLLNYLAPRVGGLSLGLMIACRSPELGEVGALLERVLSDPFAEVLQPGSLGAPAAAAVLLSATGSAPDERFVTRALAATGGNPFYLRELGRALHAEGVAPTEGNVDRIAQVRPQTLSRAILARLSAGARALAGALAVLDEPSDVHLAGEVAGLPAGEASRAADELIRAGLLRDARPLEFRHAIVRGAVLSGVTAGQRAAVHATAAAVLRGRHASDERVAVHVLATEPSGDPATVEVLRTAAGRALMRGAPEVAVRLLERAVAEPPTAPARGQVIAELAAARHQAGLADEQTVGLYQEAYRLASDPVKRYELLRDMAWVVGPDRLRQQELEPLFEQAIDELSQVKGTRALSLQLQAAHLSGTLLTGESDALAQRFEAIQELDGSDPAEGVLIALLARYMLSQGAPAAAVAQIARRAIANPSTLDNEGPDSLWLLNAVVILVQADCLDDADRLLSRALDQSRALGSANGFALVSIHRARVALRRGGLRDAEAEARGALEALIAESWYSTSATAMLMDALVQQGRLDEAQAAYDELGLGERIPDLRPATPLLIVRGHMREQQGDLERAAHDLSEALARVARFNARNAVGLDARLRLVYVHRGLGAMAKARAAVAEAYEIALAWGTPAGIGEALRAQAAVAEAEQPAIGLLREAVQHLAVSPVRLEHARALIDLGGALRRRGERSASREPLRDGLAIAEQAGAAPLEAQARDELSASGLRLRRRSEDRDRLTPSEQRIARLAAEGLTNPQIAQSLFLTIKTVEGHLSSTYRKLEIAGRTELAPELDRSGGWA